MSDLPEGVVGFDPSEVDAITREFVCAICYSNLVEIPVSGAYLSLIICPEHGNVELCGRVTRNTVSIDMERAKIEYDAVIRNLPDLWGELIPKQENPVVARLSNFLAEARYQQRRERQWR
jgi:hypothetical protein